VSCSLCLTCIICGDMYLCIYMYIKAFARALRAAIDAANVAGGNTGGGVKRSREDGMWHVSKYVHVNMY